MSTSGDHNKSSPLPKACENCRIRKIRCNRTDPCSNCSSSGIECRPSSKQTEHRPRMIVSNHYEKQIDRIHERLVGIELALRSFSVTQPTTSPPLSHTSIGSQRGSTSTPSHFEGDSSFQYQSVQAAEVARSLNTKNNGDLSNAINTLKDIVCARNITGEANHDIHFTSVEDRAPGPQMELLPAEFVIKLLGKIKERYPMNFYSVSLPNDGQLDLLCRRAYFPTDPMSLGEMTTMYGMLWCIIQEYIVFADPITKEYDCEKFLLVCEKNFHRGIETYDIMAEPSFDNAFALMLAASKAQDEGKVILCWSLSSAAARHLQALGYHRECTLKDDPSTLAEKKRHLFWTVYGIEKNMALNLGRASSFQDWDIDVKMFTLSSDPTIRPWNIGTIMFIKLSQVQGQIYEQLYSASASSKSNDERAKAIDSLSQRLDKVYGDFRKVDRSQAMYGEYFQMFYEACDVIYYSLLTILHRGAFNPDNGTEISSKCFEAAKSCLKSHLHYFPMFTQHGEAVTIGYVNWVLLYCSFTPFIVVFLHAIASLSLTDVKLLQDMTASLEPVNTLSPVLHRLHNVCKVFSRVAESVVRHHHTQQKQHQQHLADSIKHSDTPNGAANNIHPTAGLGSYDQTTDSLFFPGFTGHHGFDPHSQLPDIFMQGVHDVGDGNGDGGGGGGIDMTGADRMDLNDMSAYFGNWVSSNQPAMDFFNIDFGGGGIQ